MHAERSTHRHKQKKQTSQTHQITQQAGHGHKQYKHEHPQVLLGLFCPQNIRSLDSSSSRKAGSRTVTRTRPPRRNCNAEILFACNARTNKGHKSPTPRDKYTSGGKCKITLNGNKSAMEKTSTKLEKTFHNTSPRGKKSQVSMNFSDAAGHRITELAR